MVLKGNNFCIINTGCKNIKSPEVKINAGTYSTRYEVRKSYLVVMLIKEISLLTLNVIETLL